MVYYIALNAVIFDKISFTSAHNIILRVSTRLDTVFLYFIENRKRRRYTLCSKTFSHISFSYGVIKCRDVSPRIRCILRVGHVKLNIRSFIVCLLLVVKIFTPVTDIKREIKF